MSDEAKEKKTRIRGPRGTNRDSKITVVVEGNPKVPGTLEHRLWSLYKNDQTIADFTLAMKAEGHRAIATKTMVSDAKRGYISLQGFDKNAVSEVAAKANQVREAVAAVEVPDLVPTNTEVME